MGSMPCALISAWSLATSRRARRAPWIFGCSVLTRPASISFTPVTSETARTAMPSFASNSAVPPVERISIPRDARPRPSSTMPVLSETERRARETDMGASYHAPPSRGRGPGARPGPRANPLLSGPAAGRRLSCRRAAAAARLAHVARPGVGRSRGPALASVVRRWIRALIALRIGDAVPALLAALFTLALRRASPGDALLLVLPDRVRAAVLLRGRLAVGRRGRVADRRVGSLPRDGRGGALRGDRRVGAVPGDRRIRALRRGGAAVGARHGRRARRARRARLLVFLRALRVARRRVFLRIAEVHLRECGCGAERKRREDRDSHASSCRGRLPSLRGPSRRANLSTWSWPGPARLPRDRSRATAP